jgi:hypothetical protein
MKTKTIEFIGGVTNFKNFKYLKSKNRPVDMGHVKKLIESFKEFGASATTIIVVKTTSINGLEYYVADGQHRIIASEVLEIPLDVKVVELDEDTEVNVTKYIARLNNTNKSWSTKNFLDAYVANNIPEYKLFKSLKGKYKFTITDLMYIFLGKGSSVDFKRGTMRFENEEDSLHMARQIARIKGVIPNKAFCRRNLPKIMKGIDYKEFCDAVINASKYRKEFSENEADFVTEMRNIRKLIEKKSETVAH